MAITIQQDVHQEQVYYHDAQSWSVPAQMVGAQRQFVQALGLRYEALQRIAGTMSSVLGVSNDQGAQIKRIAGDMEMLLTSDVIYAERVAPLITQALAKAGITDQTVAPSSFLPDIAWIDPQTVAQRILGYVPTSLGGIPSTGSNGHELLSVSIRGPSGTPTVLQSGTTTINRLPLHLGRGHLRADHQELRHRRRARRDDVDLLPQDRPEHRLPDDPGAADRGHAPRGSLYGVDRVRALAQLTSAPSTTRRC